MNTRLEIEFLADIEQFAQAPYLDEEACVRSLYEHLYAIKKSQLLADLKESAKLNHTKPPFNFFSYMGLVQGAIEHSDWVEHEERQPSEEADETAENLTHLLKEKLQQLNVEPGIVKHTIDWYENYLSYELRHPHSPNNPWNPVYELFRKGILLAFRQVSFSYKPYSRTGLLLVLGQECLVCDFYGHNQVFSVQIDDRLHYQSLLFLELKQRALHKHQIIDLLKGFGLSKQKIEDNVFEPLRSMGLIDRTKQGFQLVKDKQDIETVARYNNWLKRSMRTKSKAL